LIIIPFSRRIQMDTILICIPPIVGFPAVPIGVGPRRAICPLKVVLITRHTVQSNPTTIAHIDCVIILIVAVNRRQVHSQRNAVILSILKSHSVATLYKTLGDRWYLSRRRSRICWCYGWIGAGKSGRLYCGWWRRWIFSRRLIAFKINRMKGGRCFICSQPNTAGAELSARDVF